MSCQQLEEGVPQGTSSAALSILGRFGDWRGDATPQMTAFPFCLQYHSLRSLLGRFVGRPKPPQPSPACGVQKRKTAPMWKLGPLHDRGDLRCTFLNHRLPASSLCWDNYASWASRLENLWPLFFGKAAFLCSGRTESIFRFRPRHPKQSSAVESTNPFCKRIHHHAQTS